MRKDPDQRLHDMVGIQLASDPSRIERVLPVSDEAVATSRTLDELAACGRVGDYFQGFRFGGRLYHHRSLRHFGRVWREHTHGFSSRPEGPREL